MYTVQTPVLSFPEGGKEAYEEYISMTQEVVLQRSWEYCRLVEFPTSHDARVEAVIRSYGFMRDMVTTCVNNGTRPAAVDRIQIGYTSGLGGLLRRIDIHLPPSNEFSVAFSQSLADGIADPNVEATRDFMMCFRSRSNTARERLYNTCEGVWQTIDQHAIVKLGDLVAACHVEDGYPTSSDCDKVVIQAVKSAICTIVSNDYMASVDAVFQAVKARLRLAE
jgi:hypothetical protein